MRKKWTKWINHAKENNLYSLMKEFKIIHHFNFKSVDICPKGWGGGNVSIKAEEIDVLINELQQAKKIIKNFQKSIDKQ